MRILSEITRHSVFLVECHGDTLVVIPRGDAIGFGQNQVHVELRAIEKLLQRSDINHLIVDLSRTNYFGSEMIGLISRLGSVARKGGGRIAMTHLSTDMRDILGVMNFERIWQYFNSTQAAINRIASIPITERLAFYKKPFYAAVAVAALVVGAIYFPWPNRDREYFELFVSYSTELKAMRQTSMNRGRRKLFNKQVERSLKPILNDLLARADEGDLGATYLHVAGRQGLLQMLTVSGRARFELEQEFIENMSEAAKYIEGVNPPTLEEISLGDRRPVKTSKKRNRSAKAPTLEKAL